MRVVTLLMNQLLAKYTYVCIYIYMDSSFVSSLHIWILIRLFPVLFPIVFLEVLVISLLTAIPSFFLEELVQSLSVVLVFWTIALGSSPNTVTNRLFISSFPPFGNPFGSFFGQPRLCLPRRRRPQLQSAHEQELPPCVTDVT